MIPTISDILDDLIKGSITKAQAMAWIEAHLESEFEDGLAHGVGGQNK